MSIYVYRQGASEGAGDLADILDARRVRVFENGTFYRRTGAPARRPVAGDVIVCWGEELFATIAGVKILNGAAITNKYQQALKLKEKGVPTIEVSPTRPTTTRPADPIPGLWTRIREIVTNHQPTTENVAQVLMNTTSIGDAMTHPPVPVTWLGRRFNHQGGSDLLHPPARPDFFVKKEDFTREYRLHIFNGKSIRAGVKTHREGVRNHNEWIRSYDGGWGITYQDFTSTKPMREIAKKAVEALDLQFGGVDIGEKADGSLLVLEVNRAVGLEGGTLESYAHAIEGVEDEVRGNGRGTAAR